MNERVKFIEHKGCRILHIDWTNGSSEEILAAIAEARKIIAAQPPASVLTLTSVTDAKVTRAVTEELKAYVAHNKPFVLAGAVVGLNDLKMVIFNFVNRITGRALRAMDDVADAKDWLAASRQM